MEKQNSKKWLWVGSALVSNFLFYDQGAGTNFLIFSILIVAVSLYLYPELRKSVSGKAIALGCIVTSLGVVTFHSWMAALLFVFSHIALTGFCVYPNSSLGVALPNGFYAMGLTFWKGEWMREKNQKRPSLNIARVLTWMVPVALTTLFLLLYISANPAFAALLTQNPSTIISPGRVIFLLISAYLLLAFFYPNGITRLIQLDQQTPNVLFRRRKMRKTRSFSTVGLKREYQMGWLSFVLLNALLFLFNTVDMYHLFTGNLPDGVTYSKYVHQGVNALIISIVLAIGIVMYFFRGNLNFYYKSRWLKMAAFGWIGQNVLLILTTAHKNTLYIEAYGLTEKRLGVYLYLLLTLVGLLTTYVKVRKIKTNAYLVRYTTWVFYVIFVGMTLFNWTRFITRYNLAHLPAKQVDFQYLSYLSENNLDILKDALNEPEYAIPFSTRDYIQHKIHRFQRMEAQQDWRSWNYADQQVLVGLGRQKGISK